MYKRYLCGLFVVLTAFLCVCSENNVNAKDGTDSSVIVNDGIDSFVPVQGIVLYPLLNNARNHYNKACISLYKDNYSMNIIPFNEFFENIGLNNHSSSFIQYKFAFVFTNCSLSNNPPQIQHGYKGNEERVIIKIQICNSDIRGYYRDEIVGKYETDNRSYFLISPDESSEKIAFEYRNCIVEIKFDNISFSEGSLQPLTTKHKKSRESMN